MRTSQPGNRRHPSKQTIVFNADVVGFSAMMARDPHGTIHALLSHTRWLAHAVMRFGGRVVDAPGDNLMAEFTDAAAAIRCAMAVQWQEHMRNAHLPEQMRVRFRIGLDGGEVFDVDGRLFGNPVNTAARLQAAADPGGILVSDAVVERCGPHARALRGDPRQHHLKNIPSPVGALALWVPGVER